MAHFCDLKEFKENSSFTGVVPIYKPAGRARGRIFAIPGEEFETWHTAWSQGEVFWLRDFLPKQFPHCAIYSVSYIETTQRRQNPNVYQDMHDFMQQTPIRERAPVALIAHRDAGEAVDAVIRNVWGTEGDKYSLKTSTPRRDVLAGVVFLGMSDKTYPVAYKNLIEAGPTHDLDDKTWLVRKDQPKILFKDYDLLPDRDNTNSATSAFPPIPPFLEEGNQDYKTTCECLQEVFRNFLPVDRTFHRERFEMQLQTPALDDSSMDPYDLWPSHNRTYWKLPLKPTSHPHLWVHLPANNQQSMSLSRQQIIGDEYEIVESGVWGSIGTVIEARSKAAHSRYVLPKFELMRQFGLQIWQHTEGQHTQACNVTQVHVALPYLHWDTLSSAIDYKRAVSSLRPPSRHTTQDDDPQGLLQLVRHDPDTYHPRRTLDQFYFSHAKNTDERDRDQVVSKQTLNDGSPGGQKMIMVDQIWLRLWIVEITEWQAMVCASSRLLTAFPHTSYARSDKDFPGLFDLADVLQMAVGDLEAGLRHNQTPDDDYTARQAAAILSRAVLGTLSIGHRNTSSAQQQKPNEALDKARQSLMFLELFREAIGQATDQYNSLFRKFEERIRLKGKSASEQSNLESDASAEEAVLEPSTETRNGDTGATNQSTAPGIVEGGTGSPQPPPAPGTVENTTGIQRPQPAPGVVENGTVSPMPQPAPEPGATATGDREDARSTLAAMKASRKNRKRNKVQLASVTEKADQMKLAIAIEDILDELHMLEQLFNIQQTVLSRGIAESDRVDCLKPLHNGMYHIAHEIETEYLPQVTRMIKDSERLRQSLYNLLDLEQKEESLNEAQRANQQALFAAKQALSSQDSADAAQAQSLILFVFTVVTIVFAPLSFFTSFFQLYSVEKNPDADSLAYRPDYVQKVMWGFSGTFYFSALAGAATFIWYKTKSSRAERTKELLHLDLKNNLPPDLLDEEDSENERMEEMYPKYLEERSEKRKKADEKAKKKEEKEAKKKAKQEAKKNAKQEAEERKKRGNEASRTRAEQPPATTSERTNTPKLTEQQGVSPGTSSSQGEGSATGTGVTQGQATENTANLAASTQETAPVSSPAATNSAKTDRSSTDSRRRAVSKRTAPADVEDAFSADSYGSG